MILMIVVSIKREYEIGRSLVRFEESLFDLLIGFYELLPAVGVFWVKDAFSWR